VPVDVVQGGSDEIFETHPESPVTTLVLRKGFVKLAIQTGANIVPGFVFGEKWLYHRREISPAVKNWFMRNLRMPLIVFWGQIEQPTVLCMLVQADGCTHL
jgi:hypothetical protein